jgi:MFS family permease
MSVRPSVQARVPFFYGWVVVAAAAVNGSFLLGSAQFSLSVFLVPMEDDLGWSRSTLFIALAVRQVFGGMLGPLIGPLIDKPMGPRIIMPVGALLMGLSLASVKWVSSPLEFMLTYGVMGSFAFAMVNTSMWESVVMKWFVRKRARAMVWTSFGAASASMIFPLLVTGLIAIFGWRDAWLWYGIITLAITLPASVTVRSHPEDVGLLPDGETTRPNRSTRGESTGEYSLTRAEAFHTPSFWLIGIAFAITGFTINGYQAHWIPYFREVGFSAGIAAGAVSVYGASNVASRILWAYLISRYSIHKLMVGHTVAAGLGIGFALMIHDTPALFAWAVYQGIVLGSYNYLNGLITAEYFGRMHLGAIRGTLLPPSAALRGISAVVLGSIREARGNYTAAFLFTWALWGVTTAALIGARKPKRPKD